MEQSSHPIVCQKKKKATHKKTKNIKTMTTAKSELL